MHLDAALREAAPGARVSVDSPERDAYARDLWPRGLIELQAGAESASSPAAVVWPESTEHVVGLVKLARRLGLSLVPFGAGSGVCGAVLPGVSNVIVDLKRICDFKVEPGPELDVGAGALGITLEETLVRAGYTTGHYPSSILISTVGGWVAARGAGQCSGRYGKIEDMVTALEIVLGTGEVLRARRRERGPDLLPLLVGSEGTLGVITRVGLRLHAAPTARAFAAYSFEDIEGGIRALRTLFQEGLRPAVARLYDPLDTVLLADEETGEKPQRQPPGDPGLGAVALRAVLKAPSLAARAMLTAERTLFSRAALVLVHEGNPVSVERESRQAEDLCLKCRGTPLGEGPSRAWYRHRYHVSYRQAPLFRGGAFSDTMEVAARWSRLPEVYQRVRAALSRHVLVMAHFSHSYPDGGSIYFTFAGLGHRGASSLEVYDRAWRDALSAAIDSGATLSHHHGIGRSKAPRLPEHLGPAITIVRAVKAAMDPAGIMNPGALLPEPSPAEEQVLPPPPADPELDTVSALVRVPGSMTLARADEWIRTRGHQLPLSEAALGEYSACSVNEWIGLGMPGLPDHYDDPVGVRLSGITAQIHGRRIALPGAPRQATGPDLSALFVGTRGSFGTIESATLAAPRQGATPPALLPFRGDRNPELGTSEARAFDTLSNALRQGQR